MRVDIRALTEELATVDNLFKETIYEFGSFQVSGSLGDLRTIFLNKKFIGCDMRQGLGVDKIENMMSLSLPDACAGSVITLDTLEHVENCHLAYSEMYRVLMPAGILFSVSVLCFGIHDHPSDYWRFTPMAFDLLGGKFTNRIIFSIGSIGFPQTVGGIYSKSSILQEGVVVSILKKHKADIIKIVRGGVCD